MQKRSSYEYAAQDKTLENQVFRGELWDIILKSNLTAREKTILKLFFIKGCSLQEIASQLPNLQQFSNKDNSCEVLNITPQAVSMHLRNAYQKLARLLPTKGIKPGWMDILHAAYLKKAK
jgi:DNA-binding CsgD family transcriptional regulator